jgi:hypothetical protein
MKITKLQKKATSFRLTPEALRLLSLMAGKVELSRGGLLKLLIRDRAMCERVCLESAPPVRQLSDG